MQVRDVNVPHIHILYIQETPFFPSTGLRNGLLYFYIWLDTNESKSCKASLWPALEHLLEQV